MALLEILDEDDDLLIVDKPQGLVCHPSKDGPLSSLVGRLRQHLGHDDGRLVNRLDRETGGVVVVAKHRAAARELGLAFASGQVQKRYVAVVHGAVEATSFIVDAPLGRDDASAVAIKDCVRPDGRPAVTHVKRLATWRAADGELSLIDVRPVSGRKHQIRIHLQHVGHPIVGDKIYGGDEQCYLRFVSGRLTDDDCRRLIVEHHALGAVEVSMAWQGVRRTWRARMPRSIEMLAGTRCADDPPTHR